MEQQMQKNIMGYEKIPALVLKMSVPLMFSMLIQALYNIVDSVFVSRVSETALTAVSLAFPLQNLMIAFAVGTGVGVNSYLARKLGEGRTDEAEKAASNGLFLSIVTYIVFALFGIFGTRLFLGMYTSDEMLMSLSLAYTRICLIASFGLFIDIMVERILQATGDSIHPMITQLAGAVTNIILDPIFIFTFKMGVAGAAWATVTGQLVSMVLALYYVRRNRYIRVHIRPSYMKPNARIIKEIYIVGVPTIIMNSVTTLMVSALNTILIAFNTTAVSVLGVYFKLQSFVFMPVFGLQNGMIPIIAYNYGAGNRKRMTGTVKFGVCIALAIMLIGFAVFQLFTSTLLGFFAASDYMMAIGVPALRIISFCFISAAVSISLSSTFQATGVSYASMIVSIVRQLVVLLPVARFIASFGVLDYVWFAFTIAEVVGLAVSVIFYIYVYRKKIKPLDSRIA